MARALLQFPLEIIHSILSLTDTQTLLAIQRTCRFMYNNIKGNRALYRNMYLNILDDPLTHELDWEQEVHDLLKLRLICDRKDADKAEELPFVYSTVTRLLKHSAQDQEGERPLVTMTYPISRNATLLASLFENESNRKAFLMRSFIFERAQGLTNGIEDPPKENHQQSAKLHCLYGMPSRNPGRTRSSKMYPFACSKVYDLRQYTGDSRWGPFINDGSDRVDWEKVEAILLVIRTNIKNKGLDAFAIFSYIWSDPFCGCWPRSYIPWSPEPLEPEGGSAALSARDPYGVTGTWLRVVCFLDFNDFFSYNFPLGDPLPDHVPRPALNVGEATRLILMKIRVTKVEPAGEGYRNKDHPVVHFEGLSRALDEMWDDETDSDLRGTVSMTPEGEVRWTTYSIFDGVERWKSESIQLGGIRSARGVVGNWFDSNFNPHGPCGPTAFWKVSDEDPKPEGEIIQTRLPSPLLGNLRF
ncbi:hypothetical protein B0H63DRAFT_465889 [Podospora didyma]|uniref:F-box domain-containing protein n=1 Tax=Podospora didyma TaxID=330526 RepID=A0AAE0NZF1_9PEZI|nr:hypothetical protein B0H63DRAFT_465889 [Podospora didyma]